jgi:hypothetical protein
MRVPVNDIGYATIESANALSGTADLSRGLATLVVETRRLDDLSLAPVAFVKIDVEGHEFEVLEGATETLGRDTPSVLVEVEERHRHGAVAQVKDLMHGLDYDCLFFRDGQLHPHLGEDDSCRNLLFVHPRRAVRLQPLLLR